ncbi:AraC family transcriptional regulator [Variovorax sp.]|uniref:AraC family transcriptional regulator n=1 Tax=Variovorax sp. TaxID=1871043 RepID=UPI002D25065D|nr:AraC family transcriptional regulator [Variovorax sp.]HYP85305.1 AraC family transcriptional regulator [Variovorax sp.]
MSGQEDELVLTDCSSISHNGRGSIRDEVQHVLGENFGFESTSDSRGELFEGRGHLVGGMALMVRNHTPHALVRGREHIRATQLDHYGVLMSTTCGGIDLDFDGRQMRVDQGQPVLVDLARVGVGHYGAGRDICLFLPRNALDALLPRAFDLHGVTLGGAAGEIFAQYLLSLASNAQAMRQRDGGHATSATLHLLAAALAPSFESLGLARDTLDQALHRKAQRIIEANLGNADLGAAELCAELGVSRSGIYRVFEPYGGIKAYINERRLVHCHAVIAGATQRIYMAQLADRFGFRNGAEFSRAFRRYFGYAPSDVHGQPALSEATGTKAIDSTIQSPSIQHTASTWFAQTRQWSPSRR